MLESFKCGLTSLRLFYVSKFCLYGTVKNILPERLTRTAKVRALLTFIFPALWFTCRIWKVSLMYYCNYSRCIKEQ